MGGKITKKTEFVSGDPQIKKSKSNTLCSLTSFPIGTVVLYSTYFYGKLRLLAEKEIYSKKGAGDKIN